MLSWFVLIMWSIAFIASARGVLQTAHPGLVKMRRQRDGRRYRRNVARDYILVPVSAIIMLSAMWDIYHPSEGQ